MLVSIFNDVIGPVMRGPSSSHCAAALRIGRLARDLMGGEIREVLVEFDRAGSLPTTHESQGSDMGLFGGLLGWEATDERLPNSAQALREAGVRVRIETVDTGDPHPNTYRLTCRNPHGEHSLIAVSTGGGMIEVIGIDGFEVSLFGDRHETLIPLAAPDAALRDRLQAAHPEGEIRLHENPRGCLLQLSDSRFARADAPREGTAGIARLAPVLPVPTRPGIRLPFTTCAAMLQYAGPAPARTLWELALEYERARSGFSDQEILRRMVDIVRVLRRSIAQGIAGTHYEDRVLGHQSGRFRERLEAGRLLDAGALNRMVLYVTALMEVKSAMGVIVAAPTAGACAALPGAVIGMAERMGLEEEAMARAMLAAGLIGVFIATEWSFAAEVGGCQAEGGSAAAVAAAALVTLADGALSQATAAASLALQGMLGLICDPVANRVEVPCLSKNVLAASQALSSANLALADFDPVIPFDEVVAAARQVANQMPRELRCTALGGLSITPTSLALEKQLASRRARACDACSCS
ncbi:MAG: L-serine ammonia-lyase, iron-sulfur-dependent, subunit alpha [Verrucomicrobiales bacterium]|nr:L-serine ammonia-lyase, iron-sulfur-dependent, subunit alpha [Verrucomicrobiales bacterium]MCP5519805.1 L-serine ammonia-lyase, iron-sulfur-dependent, subunit alpha [Verrucomicrobiales bacterium]